MHASWLLGLALLAGGAHAYPDMAGSCEGVFSGAHVRLRDLGRARGDGGWSFEVGAQALRVRARPATAGASAKLAAIPRAANLAAPVARALALGLRCDLALGWRVLWL